MQPRLTAILFSFAVVACINPPPVRPAEVTPIMPITQMAPLGEMDHLSELVPLEKPGRRIEAASEQFPPWNVGDSPRDVVFHGKSGSRPTLPKFMQALGKRQIDALTKRLRLDHFEIEAWPTMNDSGQLTWVLARWRRNPTEPWHWVPDKEVPMSVQPALPHRYALVSSKAFAEVFGRYDTYKDLDQKPVFGNCIWTDFDGSTIFAGWIQVEEQNRQRNWLETNPKTSQLACIALPQPARLDQQAVTFRLVVNRDKVQWPEEIAWIELPPDPGPAQVQELKISQWPASFTENLKSDLKYLSTSFARKNAAQKDNQLRDVASYLMKRYQDLGLKVELKRFQWHGIDEQNVIAVIPGSSPDHDKKPIIMADHYDTSFAQQVFADTGNRVSVHGADDNGSATVTLLRAAEILPELKLRHDVYLVHLTGEEFPCDGLGARNLVMDMLAKGQDTGGIVLLDMIGYNLYKTDDSKGPTVKDNIFQINPGFSEKSRQISQIAMAVAAKLDVSPRMTAAYRNPWGDESYLYNTDGIIFAWAGFPVVLLNEHLSRFNVNRP